MSSLINQLIATIEVSVPWPMQNLNAKIMGALTGYSLETLHTFLFTEPESVLELMIPVGCDTNEATTIMRMPLAMQCFLSYMLWIMAHIALYQDALSLNSTRVDEFKAWLDPLIGTMSMRRVEKLLWLCSTSRSMKISLGGRRSAKRARNKGPEGCWPSVGAALTVRLTWEAFERLLTHEGALRCLACLKGYYVNLFPSPLHRDSDNNLELRAPDGSARLRCVPARDLPGRGRGARCARRREGLLRGLRARRRRCLRPSQRLRHLQHSPDAGRRESRRSRTSIRRWSMSRSSGCSLRRRQWIHKRYIRIRI